MAQRASKTNRGIIQIVIMIFIGIIALSYFGIDLRETFQKPLFKKNLQFTWEVVQKTWTDYIYNPVTNLIRRDKGTDTTEVI